VALQGIDVSAIGQGNAFNWSAWKDRIAFAGIKATQGLTFQDPDFTENVKGATSIGAVRMPYHFLDPAADGAEQARHYLAYARPQPGELPMLDHETYVNAAGDALAAELVADVAAAFGDAVRAAVGAWPILYTTQYMAEHGYCAGLGQQPLFIANPSRVKLPNPIGPWRLVSFEQIGQKGIDTDVFYGTAAELARLTAMHAPIAPTPAPAPAPTKKAGFLLEWTGADTMPKILELATTDGKTWS